MKEAVHRYHTAKGYFQSALMVYTSPDRNSSARKDLTLLSINMLTAFALELYFKAWLLEAGIASAKVKAYGHKVDELYVDSKANGLPKIHLLDELVVALSDGHKDFTFRYMNDGDEIDNVNWEVAFKVFDQLDNIVDAKIGASALVGLKPGH
jgi:hypothetical protein